LKDAIEKIVLVDFGILIALQIINWNEGRKVNRKESLILNELLNSIKILFFRFLCKLKKDVFL